MVSGSADAHAVAAGSPPSRENEPWAHLVDLPRLASWMDARSRRGRDRAGPPSLGRHPERAAPLRARRSRVRPSAVDFGCLLATWADPAGSHPGCISVTPWDGFPTEAELAARYADITGASVADLNWCVVLACFRLGILQEGTYARAAAGQAERATADWMHATTIKLFERALSRM